MGCHRTWSGEQWEGDVLRSVRGMRIASAFVAGGLVLGAAACGEAPKDNKGAGTSGKKYSACMVTDVGGIDDKSFNTSAWKAAWAVSNCIG